MTYAESLKQLPTTVRWSSCFGNPGEGGYVEYYRDADATRYVVSNGDWMSFAPFDWTMTLEVVSS
jgi:hypothetical protein